jgi:hypothetical protein
MRLVWGIIGVLALIAGVIFTLQGLNILGGSAMSGERMWVIIGPIIAIVGLVLVALSLMGRRRATAS